MSESIDDLIKRARLETEKLYWMLSGPEPDLVSWLTAVDKQAGIVSGIFGYTDKTRPWHSPDESDYIYAC